VSITEIITRYFNTDRLISGFPDLNFFEFSAYIERVSVRPLLASTT
jgi:hypothetical protein